MAALYPAIHLVLAVIPLRRRGPGQPGHDGAIDTSFRQRVSVNYDAQLRIAMTGYFFTLLESILTEVSSSFVVNALSTANGFSMPR